jgi:ankyrin repeat protein
MSVIPKDRRDISPLMIACQSDDIILIKNIIDQGANLEFRDNECMTALMYASIYGKKRYLEVLIEGGASIQAKVVYSIHIILISFMKTVFSCMTVGQLRRLSSIVFLYGRASRLR